MSGDAVTVGGGHAAGSRPVRPLGRWLDALLVPLALVGLSRLALLGVAYAATRVLPAPGFVAGIWKSGGLIDAWNRWDAGWYLLVAERGYTLGGDGPALSLAFFPLYPLAMRALAKLCGDHMLAGLLISNIAFAVAAGLLYDLVRRRLGLGVARTCTLLLCVYPFSFFYSAVYTEALCLLLVVSAWWLAERRGNGLAAACSALASGTRLVGGVVAVALAWRQVSSARSWRAVAGVAALGLAGELGLLAFAAYQWLTVGDPLAMVRSSASWGGYNPFVAGLDRLSPLALGPGNYSLVLGLNLVLAVGSLLLVPTIWRRLGVDYAIFSVLCVAIPLSQRLESLGRYLCVVFPAFVALALLLDTRSTARALLLSVWTALLILLTALFATGRWVI